MKLSSNGKVQIGGALCYEKLIHTESRKHIFFLHGQGSGALPSATKFIPWGRRSVGGTTGPIPCWPMLVIELGQFRAGCRTWLDRQLSK